METVQMELPAPVARFKTQLNIVELAPLMSEFYSLQVSIEAFIGPWNARQRDTGTYVAPTLQELREGIPEGRMGRDMHNAVVGALAKFCEATQGMVGVPAPHPSTIHSIQIPLGFFELTQRGSQATLRISGIADSIQLSGVRKLPEIKFLILRPKLNNVGTASNKNWEVLLFADDHQYIPHWADSTMNPRYSGCVN